MGDGGGMECVWLFWGREGLQVVCEEPRRDGVCVGGRLKGIQKFIIMLIQVIRNNNNGITITITSPLRQGTNNQLGVT